MNGRPDVLDAPIDPRGVRAPAKRSDAAGTHPRVGRAAAVALGGVVAALVAAVVAGAGVSGVSGALLVLLVVVPSARNAARRLLTNGAVLIAWLPVLWWLPAPPASLGRTGALAAVAAGVLTGWVLRGRPVRDRAWALLPGVAGADILVPLAGAIAMLIAWPLLASRSPVAVLGRFLQGGVDNVAHFSMFVQQQAGGSASPFSAAPADGSEWYFHGYPQLYHSLISAVSEASRGPSAGAVADLSSYSTSVALLWVGIVVLTAAAIVQLPGVRRQPLFAVAAVGAVIWGLLIGPGAGAVSLGHLSFVLAASAVGLIPAVLRGASSSPSIVSLAAAAGLALTAAAGWGLLALMAGAALWPLAPHVLRTLRDSPRRRLELGLLVSALVVVSAIVVWVLLHNKVGSLAAGGAVDRRPWYELVGILLLTLVVAIAAYRRVARTDSARFAARSALLVTLAGVATLTWIVAYQLAVSGRIEYYAWKMAAGLELVCIPVAVVASWILIEDRPGGHSAVQRAAARWVAVVLVGLQAVAVLQTEGVVRRLGLEPPTWRVQVASEQPLAAPNVDRLLRAVAVAERTDPWRVTYVAALPGDAQPRIYDFWLHALTSSWSTRAAQASVPVGAVEYGFGSFQELVDVVAGVLATDPRRIVIVAPEFADGLRSALPDQEERIRNW